jgi:hypothetical protein
MNFYHRDLSYSIGGAVIGVPPSLILFSLSLFSFSPMSSLSFVKREEREKSKKKNKKIVKTH